MVSARDFILVVKKGYKGNDYFQAGCSIEHPDVPKDKKIVRAWNGPGGQLIRAIPGEPDKCELYWLMDCEYNGWIMASILTIAIRKFKKHVIDFTWTLNYKASVNT